MANRLVEAAQALFGFEIVRKQPEVAQQQANTQPSFVQKENEDGAVVIAPSGAFGTFVDLDGSIRSEAELISKYRDMAVNSPEVDAAIDEIVNEAISVEEEDTVKIILDDVDATDEVKEELMKCFEEVLDLLNFNNHAYDIIRRYYIDGRLYYHAVIDVAHPDEGVKELRYIDPRKIRKIREVIRRRATAQDQHLGPEGTIVVIKNEYYIYNERGFNYNTTQQQQASQGAAATGIRIAPDSIAHASAGLSDVNGTMVLSYLHKAIKPLNQLRAIEDASVIYRLARAPERRVWYIDVGNLPKMKAEQYVRDIMVKHKNRLTYDAATGEYRDDRKFLTMLEDYWLPRREGGKGTEVTTLPAGDNLGVMEDVLYFQKKLYSSLNVPVNRLNSDALFSLGRATEVGRDEVKFGKFIARFRNRFGQLFTKIMRRQVVLKGIMSIEDFDKIAPKFKYDFAHDNYFMEMKDNEVMTTRMDLLERVSQWVGRYYSNKWVCKYILRQSEEEVEEMKQEIVEEANDPIWSQPMPTQGGGMDGMMGDMGNMGPEELGGGGFLPGGDDMGGADGFPGGDQPNLDVSGGKPPTPDEKTPKTQQQRNGPRKKNEKKPPGQED